LEPLPMALPRFLIERRQEPEVRPWTLLNYELGLMVWCDGVQHGTSKGTGETIRPIRNCDCPKLPLREKRKRK